MHGQIRTPDPLLFDAQRACCTRSGSWAVGTSLHRLGRVGGIFVQFGQGNHVLKGGFGEPRQVLLCHSMYLRNLQPSTIVFDCLSWLCFTDQGDVLENRCQRLWWEAGGFWDYGPLSMLLRLNNHGSPCPFSLFGLSSNFAFCIIKALLYREYTNRIYIMSFENYIESQLPM